MNNAIAVAAKLIMHRNCSLSCNIDFSNNFYPFWPVEVGLYEVKYLF